MVVLLWVDLVIVLGLRLRVLIWWVACFGGCFVRFELVWIGGASGFVCRCTVMLCGVWVWFWCPGFGGGVFLVFEVV